MPLGVDSDRTSLRPRQLANSSRSLCPVDSGRFDTSDRHEGHFDALSDPWPEPWFCNPPYGRALPEWTRIMAKSGRGVALLPSRTDTAWFHDYVLPCARLEFLRGRLHFDDAPQGGTFGSVLAWYGGEQ